MSATAELPSPLKSLRKDFFLSYMHSQGVPEIQRLLFELMATSYAEADTDPRANMPSTAEWLHFDMLPKGHIFSAPVSGSDMNQMSKSFLATLQEPLSKCPEDSATKLLGKMLARDLDFQKKQRGIGNDLHASYFREHALLEKPTNSETFDAVYRQIGSLAASFAPYRYSSYRQPDVTTTTLVTAWEANHPDQVFDPEYKLRLTD